MQTDESIFVLYSPRLTESPDLLTSNLVRLDVLQGRGHHHDGICRSAMGVRVGAHRAWLVHWIE